MRRIFKDWNFKKHFAFVVSVYALILTAANAVMYIMHCRESEREIQKGGKWLKYISPEEQKKAVAKSYVSEPSKNMKIVHGVIGSCFAVDMMSYPLIKKMTKKL